MNQFVGKVDTTRSLAQTTSALPAKGTADMSKPEGYQSRKEVFLGLSAGFHSKNNAHVPIQGISAPQSEQISRQHADYEAGQHFSQPKSDTKPLFSRSDGDGGLQTETVHTSSSTGSAQASAEAAPQNAGRARFKINTKRKASASSAGKRTGNGYGAEEIVYLRTSWERVVAGEIERSACAAEVARTLKRSKSAIQGQFTWLKANAPRSTGMPRGRPRKDSSASAGTGAGGDSEGASDLPQRSKASGGGGAGKRQKAGEGVVASIMAWQNVDMDEEPQWLTGSRRKRD